MRWNEIVNEKLIQALPLRAMSGSTIKKASPLIPGVEPPMDPGTALATALPSIAQAVAGGSLAAAQQAVALDDAEEAQMAASNRSQKESMMDKEKARREIKKKFS
jgi:hypothetical protein